MTSTTHEVGEWRFFVVGGSKNLVLRRYRTRDFGRTTEVSIGDLETEKGTFLIDTEDFPKYKDFTWYINAYGYIVAAPSKTLREMYMIPVRRYTLHLAILPGFEIIDHISGDKLDNRKSNLRGTDATGNANNRKLFITNTSGFNGVHHTSRIRNDQKSKPIQNAYVVKTHRMGDNRKCKLRTFVYGKNRTKEEAFKLAVEYRKNWDNEHDCSNGIRPK